MSGRTKLAAQRMLAQRDSLGEQREELWVLDGRQVSLIGKPEQEEASILKT